MRQWPLADSFGKHDWLLRTTVIPKISLFAAVKNPIYSEFYYGDKVGLQLIGNFVLPNMTLQN